jgi:hypothetical protein
MLRERKNTDEGVTKVDSQTLNTVPINLDRKEWDPDPNVTDPDKIVPEYQEFQDLPDINDRLRTTMRNCSTG